MSGGGYKIKPFLCKVEETKQTGYNPKLWVEFTEYDAVHNNVAGVTGANIPYIDTAYKPNINTKIQIKTRKLTRNPPQYGHCPIGYNSNQFQLEDETYHSSGGAIRWKMGGKSVQSARDGNNMNVTYDAICDKTGMDIVMSGNTDPRFTPANGHHIYKFATEATTANVPSMRLFRTMTSSYNGSNTHRIWYARVWENDELLHLYIPATNCLGETGMFDAIENRFFKSKTAVNFIAETQTKDCYWENRKPYPKLLDRERVYD